MRSAGAAGEVWGALPPAPATRVWEVISCVVLCTTGRGDTHACCGAPAVLPWDALPSGPGGGDHIPPC